MSTVLVNIINGAGYNMSTIAIGQHWISTARFVRTRQKNLLAWRFLYRCQRVPRESPKEVGCYGLEMLERGEIWI